MRLYRATLVRRSRRLHVEWQIFTKLFKSDSLFVCRFLAVFFSVSLFEGSTCECEGEEKKSRWDKKIEDVSNQTENFWCNLGLLIELDGHWKIVVYVKQITPFRGFFQKKSKDSGFKVLYFERWRCLFKLKSLHILF